MVLIACLAGYSAGADDLRIEDPVCAMITPQRAHDRKLAADITVVGEGLKHHPNQPAAKEYMKAHWTCLTQPSMYVYHICADQKALFSKAKDEPLILTAASAGRQIEEDEKSCGTPMPRGNAKASARRARFCGAVFELMAVKASVKDNLIACDWFGNAQGMDFRGWHAMNNVLLRLEKIPEDYKFCTESTNLQLQKIIPFPAGSPNQAEFQQALDRMAAFTKTVRLSPELLKEMDRRDAELERVAENYRSLTARLKDCLKRNEIVIPMKRVR